MLAEKTVLASFYSEPEAKDAVRRIRELGVETTQIDELDPYGGVPSRTRIPPISGNIPSLVNYTLGTSPGSKDADILLSADPAASGMADGEDNVTGRNYLLTVLCAPALVEEVVAVIKDCNGYT